MKAMIELDSGFDCGTLNRDKCDVLEYGPWTPVGLRMTRWRGAITTLSLCLVALVAGSGCGRLHSDFGLRSTEASWTKSLDGIYGIDQASVSVVTFQPGAPDEASFVVWSDVLGYSARGTSTSRSANYEAICVSGDGKGMQIRGAVSEGRPVTVRIAGTAYDLKKGAVFLVAARGTSPKILQLDMEPKLFGNKHDQLVELARSTESIRTFFETETKNVPPSPKRRS